MAEDPYASIISHCHYSSSQEDLLSHSLFAREDETFSDADSPEPPPSAAAGITICSAPDTPTRSNDDGTPKAEEYKTPPEESRLSSSEELLPLPAADRKLDIGNGGGGQRGKETGAVGVDCLESKAGVDLGAAKSNLGFSEGMRKSIIEVVYDGRVKVSKVSEIEFNKFRVRERETPWKRSSIEPNCKKLKPFDLNLMSNVDDTVNDSVRIERSSPLKSVAFEMTRNTEELVIDSTNDEHNGVVKEMKKENTGVRYDVNVEMDRSLDRITTRDIQKTEKKTSENGNDGKEDSGDVRDDRGRSKENLEINGDTKMIDSEEIEDGESTSNGYSSNVDHEEPRDEVVDVNGMNRGRKRELPPSIVGQVWGANGDVETRNPVLDNKENIDLSTKRGNRVSDRPISNTDSKHSKFRRRGNSKEGVSHGGNRGFPLPVVNGDVETRNVVSDNNENTNLERRGGKRVSDRPISNSDRKHSNVRRRGAIEEGISHEGNRSFPSPVVGQANGHVETRHVGLVNGNLNPNKEVMDENTTRKPDEGMNYLLDMLKLLVGDMPRDNDDDIDILETAKSRGMTFPQPRWWKNAGQDD